MHSNNKNSLDFNWKWIMGILKQNYTTLKNKSSTCARWNCTEHTLNLNFELILVVHYCIDINWNTKNTIQLLRTEADPWFPVTRTLQLSSLAIHLHETDMRCNNTEAFEIRSEKLWGKKALVTIRNTHSKW